MKKFLSAAIAATSLLAVTGCAGGAGSSSTGSSAASSPDSGAVTTAAAAGKPAGEDLSADIQGNTTPSQEQIDKVYNSINDSYLGDLYSGSIPQQYGAYPMEGTPEIDVWMPIDAFLSSLIPSLNEFEIYQKAQEYTGIKVNFQSPPVGQENDSFNIMIASGDLPDVVVDADKYAGGVEAGVNDGAYQDLTELIPQYAPNYNAFRESDENRRKTTVTDTGKLVGLYGLSPYSEWMWFGTMIKQEALDKTGMAAPETIEEWDAFLAKCKEAGYNYPLNYGSTYGQIWTDIINGAYGVYDWKFVNEEGRADWGPAQPNAKDYLTLMADWQKKGYFNNDWTTADFNQRMAEAVSDDCAAMMDSPDTMWGFWKTGDKNIDFVGVPNPVLKKGDTPKTTYKNWSNTGRPAAITTQCKNVEAALRWLDFGFTRKGWELYNWGEYGKTHVVNSEGLPYFHDESIMYNDPDKQPLANLIWKYRVHSGPNIRDEHFSNPLITAKGSYSGKIRQEWTEAMDTSPAFPPVSLTPEEASREASIGTQLSTLRGEYFSKIIMGELPVSAYDEFLAKAEQMGLEEWKGLWQAALDRYNAR